MDLIVLAKEPVPGRVKTRLCPPCTAEQAAALAAAALHDTLAAATATRADRVVLALDGEPGPWCPSGVLVVDQGEGSLADRLEAAWRHAAGPAVLVGMDTPQVGPDLLDAALGELRGGGHRTAVFGPAVDGGWWLLGATEARPGLFAGIETSRADTGAQQLERLRATGAAVRVLPTLVDVDTMADAGAVAAAAPRTRFAAAVAALGDRAG